MGIYGIKIKYCPVVRCETLLQKGNGATSKTEKLIEGETRYEYLSIFPEFLMDLDQGLHVLGKCEAIECKLLKECDPNDVIGGTDAQITDTSSQVASAYRI